MFIIENNLTDRIVSEQRDTDSRVKVLAIDEESLTQIGRWPWSRDVMADVVENLASIGAEAVWIDVLYTEPGVPEHDQRWAELVEQHDNIFLSVYFEFPSRQSTTESLQYDMVREPVIPIESNQLGHINVFTEEDRIVRRVILGVEKSDGDILPAISVVLANRLLPEHEQITWDNDKWKRGDTPLLTSGFNQTYFGFASTPEDSRFDIVPFHRVYSGAIPPSYFEDAVVMIGPYATGMQDQYYTPGNKTLQMYGVEIHANIVQSLLDEHIYEQLSRSAGIGLIIAVFAAAYSASNMISARWAVVLLIASIILYTIATFVVYAQMDILLPYFYPLLALIMAYVASLVVQYIQETLDKRKVTNLFGRYVSGSVVDEILSTDEEVRVGGVRKDVTLMFVDIRGFTTLSEKIEPEEVIQILNEYLDLATQSVFAEEGTIDKFMGDGVMAIFGAPLALENHPVRAVKAALLLRDQEEAMGDQLMEKYGRKVRFGVGINSGYAVIGNIGSEDRLDYTAIGDTVNLAARLESNAKPGQVLISPDTYDRVKDQFICEKLEPIKVKGKEHPVQIYGVTKEIIKD